MKKVFLFLPLLIVLNASLPAFADTPSIGYVDMRQVLLESKIGKKKKAEFEKLVKEKESQLSKEEEKLKAMEQAFQKEQLLMTEEQKQAKRREYQEKSQTFQRMVRDAKEEVARKDSEFTAKAVGEVRAIVADLAKSMKLQLVLEASESGLLYADDALNLTPKVMERYDAKAH